MQINSAKHQEHLCSSSICNECVLNINNFYTFKKKVLEAQELINTLTIRKDPINDSTIEYVEDDMMVQLVDSNEDPQLLEEDFGNGHETEKTCAQTDAVVTQEQTRLIRIVKVDKFKKRENNSSGPKSTIKKSKIDKSIMEKITIQMNECLICPAILGDILQLKDHIESHTDVNCKACNRQFARYSNLKRHFNSVHSKPKPFQCDICGLGFNFSVNLQAHAALHYSGKIRNE